MVLDLIDSLLSMNSDLQTINFRNELEELRRSHEAGKFDPDVLVAENWELKLRLGLLIRLLIQKGIFTAEEYAALMTAARQQPS